MEIIKYKIGDTLHEFTVKDDELSHVKTGKVISKINKAEKHPCGCKLLTPRVAGVAALNRLLASHTPEEINKRLL